MNAPLILLLTAMAETVIAGSWGLLELRRIRTRGARR